MGHAPMSYLFRFLLISFSLHACSYSFANGFLVQEHGPRRLSPAFPSKGWKGSEIPATGRPGVEPQYTTRPSSFDIDKNEEEQNHLMGTFGLYVQNLQKHRKTKNTKTALSLSYFLRENPSLHPHDADQLIEVCERALIQAIRTAGDAGDYKLILQLVDNSIIFADGNPILTPRIFGEALNALSQTGANFSKLKSVWKLVAKGASFLQSRLTAFELNVMLKAVAKKGKVSSCLDLYRQHATQNTGSAYICPDAYTASTLFSLLKDSISSDQKSVEAPVFRTSSCTSSFQSKLMGLSKSPCWQWNAAVDLLGTLGDDAVRWNNHAYSSLLKLHDRVQDVFEDHENGSSIVLTILNTMRIQGLVPDVITCTIVIKALGDSSSGSKSWKLAVRFLNQMMVDENLPNPNAYSYSAAIVACARSRQYNVALELLDQMRARKGSNFTAAVVPSPNTWVYNAVLLAIGNPQNRRRKQRTKSIASKEIDDDKTRRNVALELLDQMEMDRTCRGFDTRPDTVTYNTILSLLAITQSASNSLVFSLLDRMIKNDTPRDATTYQKAVLASNGDLALMELLKRYMEDEYARPNGSKKSGIGLTFVFNSALSVASSRGNLMKFQKVFTLMQDSGIPCDGDTTSHLLTVIGKSKNADMLASILQGPEQIGNLTFWEQEVLPKTGINLRRAVLPPLHVSHYAGAISTCLAGDKLENAHAILSIMHDNDMVPSSDCMENFASAYARAATNHASRENSNAQHGPLSNSHTVAVQCAEGAYGITMALANPSPSILGVVAKACAVTGQWKHSREVLCSIQKRILADSVDDEKYHQDSLDMIGDLQSVLLGECARQGNVSAALSLANAIQRFSTQYLQKQPAVSGSLFLDGAVENDFLGFLQESPLTSRVTVGMKVRDWIAVMKAARKSGHWRVCFNTLQILRPYVERTNPKMEKDGNEEKLENRYKQLVPALLHATTCLEQESKYAWAVRSIKDWALWSGRKVPPEAVMSAIRVLSARGRSEEVKDLLLSCIHSESREDNGKEEVSYEQILYVGAVTSLHKFGLYDDADEIYVSGVSEGHLPLDVESRNDQVVLDLHGLNVAMAHSVVRIAMRQQTALYKEPNTSDMMIITGLGRNSALHLRPVLRPEIQRMLVEEFYPPLNTVSVPGNMGALVVSADDISQWQAHQEGQKGARMLAVAAALRDLSATRLRQSIALNLKTSEEKEQ